MEKLYKVEIAKNPQSIVDAIRFYELKFGESYLEYHDIFQGCREIMNFAHDIGILSTSKYESWMSDWDGSVFHMDETFQVIFGEDEEYEPFCITYKDMNSDKEYDKQYEDALLVYGALICSRDDYFNRFVDEYSSGEGSLGYIEVVKA